MKHTGDVQDYLYNPAFSNTISKRRSTAFHFRMNLFLSSFDLVASHYTHYSTFSKSKPRRQTRQIYFKEFAQRLKRKYTLHLEHVHSKRYENSGGGGGGRGAAAFDLLHCVGNLKMRKQKYQRQAFHAILQLLRWRKLFVKDILFQDNPISDHTPHLPFPSQQPELDKYFSPFKNFLEKS